MNSLLLVAKMDCENIKYSVIWQEKFILLTSNTELLDYSYSHINNRFIIYYQLFQTMPQIIIYKHHFEKETISIMSYVIYLLLWTHLDHDGMMHKPENTWKKPVFGNR